MAKNPFKNDEVLVCETHPALFAAVGLFRDRQEAGKPLHATLIEPSPSGKGVFIVAANGPDLAIAFDPEGRAQAPVTIAGADEVDTLARATAGLKNGKARLRFIDRNGALYADSDNGTSVAIKALEIPALNWRAVLELKEPPVAMVIEHVRLSNYNAAAKLLHKGNLSPNLLPVRFARAPGWGPIEIGFALNGEYRFSVVARPMRWQVDESLRLCDWVMRHSAALDPDQAEQHQLPSVA